MNLSSVDLSALRDTEIVTKSHPPSKKMLADLIGRVKSDDNELDSPLCRPSHSGSTWIS
jgi:hypothetical protein